MSEVSHLFTVNSRVAACVDDCPRPSRFGLGYLHVEPANEGSVYLVGCDSRCLSIVTARGHATGDAFVPPDALPKPSKVRNRDSLVSINGSIEAREPQTLSRVAVRETPIPDSPGYFPDCARILPTVGTSSHVALCFNAKLLAKLAAALSGDGESITLFVPTDAPSVAEAVPVYGAHGIGVLMPLATDDDSRFADYNTQRDAYVASRAK